MPGSGGISDFLDLHANVFRRVRNLETGVHPTRTEAGLDDLYPPTSLPLLGGTPWHAPIGDIGPGWQRRAGFVQLFGQIETSTGWGGAGEYHIANLPTEARPGRNTGLMLVPGEHTDPPFGYVRAQTDGKLYIVTPDGADGTNAVLWLEGPSWTV